MNAPLTDASRCFQPFYDVIDGVVCLPADATAADIRAQAGPHQQRFPLLLDDAAPLREQLAAATFAPASSRFGPFCDNVLGMNWRLPNGHVVRIGERVVKTTTGYDLFRFLLHSGDRFGSPVDYVLRLRPDCAVSGLLHLTGDAVALQRAIPELLQSSWMLWYDSIDLLAAGASRQLRIAVNCPADEWPLFENFLKTFATTHTLRLQSERDVPAPTDGCPDLVFKTAPEQLLALVDEVSRTPEARCVAFCYCGVLHVFLPAAAPHVTAVRVQALVSQHAERLHAIGGDWHSRHLPPLKPSATEAAWIATLEQESQRS